MSDLGRDKNVTTVAVSVLTGETRSAAFEAAGVALIGLGLPANLTSTSIGLEVEIVADSDVWLPVVDSTGAAVAFTVAASQYAGLAVADLPGFPGNLRLVMGTAEADDIEITAVVRKL